MSIFESDLILQWGNSPYAWFVLILLSFSESAFFIIPPEILLIPMALANPALAIAYGVVTTIASVFGAAFGFFLGKKGGKPLLYKFFAKEKIEAVRVLFHKYDTKAIFIAAFTPIPFKVFTVASGVFDLDFKKFVLTSIAGRGTRYLLIAGMIAIFGESIRYFLEHQFDKAVAVGTVLLIGLFIVYKFGLPYLEERILKQSLKDKILSVFRRFQ